MSQKIYIYIRFDERDEAKKMGCSFDSEEKSWYFIDGSINEAKILKRWKIIKKPISKQKQLSETIKEPRIKCQRIDPKAQSTMKKRSLVIQNKSKEQQIDHPQKMSLKKNNQSELIEQTQQENEERIQIKQNEMQMILMKLKSANQSQINYQQTLQEQEEQVKINQTQDEEKLSKLKNATQTKIKCNDCDSLLYHSDSLVFKEIYVRCECHLCEDWNGCKGEGSYAYENYQESCDICLVCNKKSMCIEDSCFKKSGEFSCKEGIRYEMSDYKCLQFPKYYSKFCVEKKQEYGFEIQNLIKLCQICKKVLSTCSQETIYKEQKNPSLYECQCQQIDQVHQKFKSAKVEQKQINKIKIQFLCEY